MVEFANQANLLHLSDDEKSIVLRPVLHRNAVIVRRNMMKQLWNSFNFWIKCPLEKQKILTRLGDSLHNIILITDDVQDNTVLRRGIPTAHLVYGLPSTVYGIIYGSLDILNKFLGLAKNQSAFFDHFIQVGIELFSSQGLEIYFRDKVVCPTMADYQDIIYGKAVAPLVFGNRVLQIFDEKISYEFNSGLLENISTFAQVYNDYINLHNPKYSSVRVFCDDLDEGKFTFPMIHAIQTYPDDNRVLNIIKEETKDIEKKKHFVKLLEDFGSFEYTRKTLKSMIKGVDQEIELLKLEKNPHLKKLLEDIYNNIETETYFDGCD